MQAVCMHRGCQYGGMQARMHALWLEQRHAGSADHSLRRSLKLLPHTMLRVILLRTVPSLLAAATGLCIVLCIA